VPARLTPTNVHSRPAFRIIFSQPRSGLVRGHTGEALQQLPNMISHHPCRALSQAGGAPAAENERAKVCHSPLESAFRATLPRSATPCSPHRYRARSQTKHLRMDTAAFGAPRAQTKLQTLRKIYASNGLPPAFGIYPFYGPHKRALRSTSPHRCI